VYRSNKSEALKHLLVVSHNDVESYARSKWFALREVAQDLDIIVITPKYWLDPEFGHKKSIAVSAGRLRFIPMRIWGSGYVGRHLYLDSHLLSLLRNFKPEIIYAEVEPWQALYCQLAMLQTVMARKAKLCAFSWWNTPDWKTPLRFPGCLTYKFGLSKTSLIVAGNHGAAELHAKHGFSGPIKVIPQTGVNLELNYPAPPDPELVERFKLAAHFVIGFVGRLHWRKGVPTLLEAVSRLKELNWKVLIVGEGPQKDELIALAHKLGIGEKVEFTGAILNDQVPDYIRLLNLLVLPSTKEQWEQFGRVLVEAMACGVPVVGSASGEIPKIIDNDSSIFPIGDSMALTAIISKFIKSLDYVTECRLKGIARVKDKYSDKAIAQRLYKAFEAL
jgi:glycosyltransferase involved in cell wall biosynthesis